ncbi:MAG: hypothetical protein LBQ47_03470 [Endomicrobium sp.]|jgi:predicted Zn-dependent protease|nr:hypothetical protein [Endomicrobium sp.]
MKKFLLFLILAQTALGSFALTPKDEMIFKAMEDEMKRSMSELKMDNMPRPYFITYKIHALKYFGFDAQSGSLIETRENENLTTQVLLRVGTQKEDNSFFDSNIYSSSARQAPSFSYDGLRARLWQLTDRVYKDSLSLLAKKQAYKKNKNIDNNYKDFSPAEPAVYIEDFTPQIIDKDYWENLAKELSAQGDIKEIDNFEAAVNIEFRPIYFITSEGAKYTKDYYHIVINLIAKARTKNGFELEESKRFTYADFKDIPTKEELIKQARDFALQTAALTKAEKVKPFIGPVLLESAAAATLFNNQFFPNISRPKPVLSERYDPTQGEFSLKKGLKIMPAGFDVIDDPLTTVFDGVKLIGSYRVDDEGTAAQKLDLITNGKLTTLPATRSLFEGQKATNGHAMARRSGDDFAQAYVKNLFFKPRSPIAAAEFKNKFLEYCRQEGLDYCYIIRGSVDEDFFSAYKINAKTGEETPVYGATIKDLGARTLRDIKYAADDAKVYNITNSISGISIITPSVILSEVEIKPTQKLPARKPLVPKP